MVRQSILSPKFCNCAVILIKHIVQNNSDEVFPQAKRWHQMPLWEDDSG